MKKKRRRQRKPDWTAAHELQNWRSTAEALLDAIRDYAPAWHGEEYGLFLARRPRFAFAAADAAVQLFKWFTAHESCVQRRCTFLAIVETLLSDAAAADAFQTAFEQLLDERECAGR